MRAVYWEGTNDIRVERVPDPAILNARDAIIRVTSTAIWGCGPVGQFALRSAVLLGAGRVIAIDTVPERLRMAAEGGAETLDSLRDDVFDRLKAMTGGIGPDACIDAVGLEAHGASIDYWYDKAKTAAFLATDRASALRQAIHCCRKGGTVSIPGVYGGFIDKVPVGAAFAKGLTLKMGQTHVHRYLPRLLRHIENGESGSAGCLLPTAY